MVLASTDFVPRADYDAALADRAAALTRAESAEARLAALEQQLAALKRQRFGASSERNVSSDLRQVFSQIYVVIERRGARMVSGGSAGTTSLGSGTDGLRSAGGAGLMQTFEGGCGRIGGPLIQRSGCLA